jgi:hypothetical protein
MKFFTPELYLQFNSDDDKVADRADALWEKALAAYRRHLTVIHSRLPNNVRQLTEINLHDADVLSLQEAVEPTGFSLPKENVPGPIWQSFAVLSLRQENLVTTLFYTLADHLRRQPAPKDWRFSKERQHWLYDELDLAPDFRADHAVFLQRILFSDGSVLEIPFGSVVVHRYDLPVAATVNGARRTA